MAPLSSYFSTFLSSHPSSSKPYSLNARSDTLSPLEVGSYLRIRQAAKPPPPSWNPGAGAVDPFQVNNHAFFALFALLGVAFCLGGIWFFFWAKNGGFRWRKGDWEDYKTTVLRKKGPNGTTLSGATKTTRLGGGSVVAHGAGDSEKGFKRGVQANGKKSKVPRGNRNNDDIDVRAYRHEKPAKVGGLNREPDAIFHQDFAYTDTNTNTYSDEVSSQAPSSIGGHIPINTPRAKRSHSPTKKPNNPTPPSPKKKKSPFYATPSSNTSTDSHRPLRPNAQSPAGASTPSRSRHSSPTKHTRNSVPGSFYTEPLDFDSRYSASNSEAGVTEDSRGTKAYFHPIPGLGTEGRGGSGGGGFRRGRGRRDSLSDSEGETNVS